MSTAAMPRIPPILPSGWNEEIHDALGAFPKSRDFVLARWAEGSDLRGMHLLGTLARYPALAKAFLTFNAHVAGASSLSARERELLILRISWLRRSDYELVQHLVLGRRAGLGEDEIERIGRGPDAPGWSEQDAALLRAADELHAAARLSENTWARLATRYSEQQLMDLVFCVACYETIAMAANSFATQLEPGVAPLDPVLAARLHSGT